MSGKEGVHPAMNLTWTTLLTVVIIGAFSLFSIYLGFQAYGDESEKATYYLIIGATGFAAMGYMLFRTKAYAQKRHEIPHAEVITTLECPKCGLKKVRDFERGDYVFRDDIQCTRCDGKMVITRVHRRKKEAKEKAEV